MTGDALHWSIMPNRTPEQIAALLRSPAVVNCTPNRIIFAKTFKMEALARTDAGEPAYRVFHDHGLDGLLDSKTMTRLIHDWRQAAGGPNGETMRLRMRVAALEAEVARLRELVGE